MAQAILKQYETIRTTVRLPVELVERSEKFIDEDIAPSRNALIVAALESFLDELEREEIDRQFRAMAEDTRYQTLNEVIAEEFDESDWEALRIEEDSQQ